MIIINKCDDPQRWYADRVGQTVETYGDDVFDNEIRVTYYCSQLGRNVINYVQKSDCEAGS